MKARHGNEAYKKTPAAHAVLLACLAAWLCVSTARGGPAFAAKPSATLQNGKVLVSFACKEACDVTVAIRNAAGKTVRHLAAGVLGSNAPLPFQKDALRQTLTWDGKDDSGRPVPKGTYAVHVGLGTTPRFERIIGHAPWWMGASHALAVGPKGNLYVLGGRGICVFDRSGKYLRQIAPSHHTLPEEKLAGRRPVRLEDGSLYYSRPYALLDKMKAVGSMVISSDGQILIPGPSGYARNVTRIGIDGSVSEYAFDTKLTRLSDVGYLYLAVSPDSKTLYMSGAEAGYRGDDARKAVYRQVVYRLLLDTPGPAEIFTGDDENSGGGGFRVNRPKGMTTDPQGRLYVCNYRGNNIAVYTPGGGFIRSIRVPSPQQVAVHPKTGKLYVLAGKEKGYYKYGYDYPPTMLEARLLRLAADGTVETELELDPPYARTGKTRPGPSFTLRMAADFTGKRPLVWIGVAYPAWAFAKWRLVRIEDKGDAFGAPEETMPKPEGVLTGAPLNLCLDRKRDILYAESGKFLVRFKGNGEALPPMKLWDPAQDLKKSFYLGEIMTDRNGDLHVVSWTARYGGYKQARIRRFTPEGKQIPLAGDRMESDVIDRICKGAGATRGFHVAPSGDYYVLYYDQKRPDEGRALWERGWVYNTAVAHLGPDGSIKDAHRIAYLRGGAQGLRVDSRGNIYVGDNVMPIGVAYPSDLSKVLENPLDRPYPAMMDGEFDPLMRWLGSVFKFGPGGGKMIGLPDDTPAKAARRPEGDLWKPVPDTLWFVHGNHKLKVTGAEWQYHGFSPVPSQYQGVTHVERCVCAGGRFDIDEFDRVCLPDNMRHRVTLLDSAGNVVTRFGQYGNQDAAGPEIRFTSPWWTAAAADRVYVGERSARIVKVRLEPTVQGSAKVKL